MYNSSGGTGTAVENHTTEHSTAQHSTNIRTVSKHGVGRAQNDCSSGGRAGGKKSADGWRDDTSNQPHLSFSRTNKRGVTAVNASLVGKFVGWLVVKLVGWSSSGWVGWLVVKWMGWLVVKWIGWLVAKRVVWLAAELEYTARSQEG